MARSQDRISALPVELRVHILSFLPTKDAGRTALLSKTWQTVWQSACKSLELKSGKAFNRALSAGCFRNLKVLHLRVNYPDKGLKKLFDGCPVLEELKFEFDPKSLKQELALNVTSLTLKRLYIQAALWDNLTEYRPGFVVKAPNLEYININDNAWVRYEVDYMPCLRKAIVNVGHCSIRFSYKVVSGYAFNILGAIANTWYLDLTVHTMAALIRYSKKLPQFLKLTKLKLEIHVYFGWNLFTHFLENSPILEVLNITKVPENVYEVDEGDEEEEDWNAPQRVPSCLLRIKKLNFKNIKGEENELEGVEYLLGNATVLEKMVVRTDSASASAKQQCQEILKFPKASERCVIEIL